jgi:hypothetical protein
MIEDSQQCLDHEKGPLFAADFFDYGADQFAFLTAHHIVIDLVSWRLLLEELEEILRGGTLLPPALPFQKWAELQIEHAETLEFDKVLPPVDVPPLDFAYWGIQREDNTYGNASHALFELDPDVTSNFLTNCHAAYKTEPVELLLASLIQSWSRVFIDRPVPAIFNEGHGREPWSSELDISYSCATVRGPCRHRSTRQRLQTPNSRQRPTLLRSTVSDRRRTRKVQDALANGDTVQLPRTVPAT